MFSYMMNLNNLYAFFISAEHLNFSKAAGILGISQPSLSQQIKNLEEEVGAPLFLRNGKSVSLTSLGHELKKSSGLFDELRAEIETLNDLSRKASAKPKVRLMVTDEVERPFVAEVVAKVAKRLGGKLEIYSSTTDEALCITASNQTDILLSHEKVNSSWNHIKIEFPVYLVTSSTTRNLSVIENPANVQKVLDYLGEDLIIPSRSMKLGKEFAVFKRQKKFRKNVMMESNIISCLVRFVASGTGCSFLPVPYIKSSLYENHLHLIGPREGYWKHAIYVYAKLSAEELEIHPLVKTIRDYGNLV